MDKILADHLFEVGVPKRYIKKTDKKEYTVPFGAVVAKAKVGSLFIFGEVGTGKTQLAIDVMAELSEQKKIETIIDTNFETKDGQMLTKDVTRKVLDRKLFRFINAPRFLTRVRNTFNNEGSLEEYLEEIDLYQYLILDDFGAEKPSEWVVETLYLLVADRYEKEKGIIITSNKSIKELSRTLGDRITSRIVEMCEIIELKGGDKRLQ